MNSVEDFIKMWGEWKVKDIPVDAVVELGKLSYIMSEPDFHIVKFDDDGWTLKHPVRCRPNLFECVYNHLGYQDLYDANDDGEYPVHQDGNGHPVLGAKIDATA